MSSGLSLSGFFLRHAPVLSSEVLSSSQQPEKQQRDALILENGVPLLETKELSTFVTVSSRPKQIVICRLHTKR
jgi:hypothetical protein